MRMISSASFRSAHASLHYDLPGAVLLLQDVVTDRCLGTMSQTVALARCHIPLPENVVFCNFVRLWRREPKMQAPGAVRYSLTSVRDVLRLSIC